jgi:hypothetical protein
MFGTMGSCPWSRHYHHWSLEWFNGSLVRLLCACSGQCIPCLEYYLYDPDGRLAHLPVWHQLFRDEPYRFSFEWFDKVPPKGWPGRPIRFKVASARWRSFGPPPQPVCLRVAFCSRAEDKLTRSCNTSTSPTQSSHIHFAVREG